MAGYCNAYAAYRDVTEKLKGEDYCIERETRNGTMIVKKSIAVCAEGVCRRDEKVCGALWNDSGRAIKGSGNQGG